MKKKLLSDDVFLVDVIAVSGTREEAQKVLDTLKVEHTLGGNGCCYAIPDNGGFVLWLMDSNDFYVLMHETLHLVVAIFESKGVNINLANEEETIAYYQSFWFRKLWRWFGNINKKETN